MTGSTWGTMFRITTWRESYGRSIGVVIDGCPIGLELSEVDIQIYLDKREPGQGRYTAMRQEGSRVEILSGVFEGRTTRTPISLLVRDQDQRSHDCSKIVDIYQPGHAGCTFDEKYGFWDYRGGGRSSGRETIGRVVAGAMVAKLLSSLGVQVMACICSIDGVEVTAERFDTAETGRSRVCMPDTKAAALAGACLDGLMEQKDSAGDVMEYVVNGMLVGIGETISDRLDARLAQAMTSIGAMKGVEVGDGFVVAKSSGFGNSDESYAGAGGGVEKRSNHPGGTLGDVSDGSRIVLRAAFKPTPSIASEQYMVNRDGESADVVIKGRHDPIAVLRAVVVVECMTALTILDMVLCDMISRLDRTVKFYDRGRAAERIMGGTR